MDPWIFAGVIGLIYGVLLFFDSFFRSCMLHPYISFLEGTGLKLKILGFQWHTAAFNRPIVKWASTYPRLFGRSFDIGVYSSLILLPVSLFFIVVSAFHSNASERGSSPPLEILVPGINLPLDEIWYYVSALAICSIFHELGHAFAAVLEDVQLTGFGLYVLGVLPVAYTELDGEQLNGLRFWRKLRVLCAGIWHNLLLATICYVIVICLPTLMIPFYNHNAGVLVTHVEAKSPIYGAKGLGPGDVITGINGCHVIDRKSMYSCLLESIRNQPAYCVTSDYVIGADESTAIRHVNDAIVECCDRNDAKVACFEYASDTSTGVLELPQFMCLNIRQTIEHSLDFCHKTSDCSKASASSFCIKPMLNNFTTIMNLKRMKGKEVMYMGHPSDVSKTVRVSEFIPTQSILGALLPERLILFFKYIAVFSLGLAIVNVLPCFWFDGANITKSLIHHNMRTIVKEKPKRELIVLGVTCLGTLLIVFTLLKTIAAKFYV